LALVAITLIVVYLCWLMLQPFVDVLLWGVVLAIVSHPVYQRLRERGRSSPVAAMVTTVLVVLVVLIPMALITAMLVRQVGGAMEAVQRVIARLLDPNSATFKWLDSHIDLDALKDPQKLGGRVSAVAGAIAERTLGIVGGVLGGIVQVFFVLFTLYYLLRDSDRIVPAVRDSLPLAPGQVDIIFRRTWEVIDASLRGVLMIAAVQATLGFLAFLVLGVPSALLWGVVMFIMATIPMLGTPLVWGPAALYLLVVGHPWKAVVLVAWGGGVVGTIDNVLRPRLVGQRARLHELVTFFAVLGGLQVFGVLGLVVGPVVAAIALALKDVWREANAVTDGNAVVEGKKSEDGELRMEDGGAGDGAVAGVKATGKPESLAAPPVIGEPTSSGVRAPGEGPVVGPGRDRSASAGR
jgi:predicted PurR-regulated permease PerM